MSGRMAARAFFKCVPKLMYLLSLQGTFASDSGNLHLLVAQVWIGCCIAMAGTVLITIDHTAGDAASSQTLSLQGEPLSAKWCGQIARCISV